MSGVNCPSMEISSAGGNRLAEIVDKLKAGRDYRYIRGWQRL